MRLLINAGLNYVPMDHTLPTSQDERPILKPNERPSMVDIVSELTSSLWYVDQLAHQRTIDAKEVQIGKVQMTGYRRGIVTIFFCLACLNSPLTPRISKAIFKAKNVQELYSHQVAAIDSIRRGRHVVVSTSTASGKSLIYQVRE